MSVIETTLDSHTLLGAGLSLAFGWEAAGSHAS